MKRVDRRPSPLPTWTQTAGSNGSMKRHNPMAWLDFYWRAIERLGLGVYFAQECQEYLPLFATIQRHVRPGGRLLQVGIGPGTLAVYLSRCGYSVVGVEDNPDLVALARDNNARLEGAAQFQLGSMFSLEQLFGPNAFDAVFSASTLDHLVDEEIVNTLREQFRVAPLNIMSVHCDNLVPEMRGLYEDDKLVKPRYWKNAIRRAGGMPVDTFGYAFSASRLGRLNWRIPVLAEGLLFRRLARFAAITGFVARRRPLGPESTRA